MAGEVGRVNGAWSRPELCPQPKIGHGKCVSRRQMRQDHAGRGQCCVRALGADTDSGTLALRQWAEAMHTVVM